MTREQTFHEALEAYGRARVMATNLKCTWPEDAQERREALASAEARVTALYDERQGEVYYVGAWRLDGSDRDLPAVALDASFKPGDKVRVTKVEEAK